MFCARASGKKLISKTVTTKTRFNIFRPYFRSTIRCDSASSQYHSAVARGSTSQSTILVKQWSGRPTRYRAVLYLTTGFSKTLSKTRTCRLLHRAAAQKVSLEQRRNSSTRQLSFSISGCRLYSRRSLHCCLGSLSKSQGYFLNSIKTNRNQKTRD